MHQLIVWAWFLQVGNALDILHTTVITHHSTIPGSVYLSHYARDLKFTQLSSNFPIEGNQAGAELCANTDGGVLPHLPSSSVRPLERSAGYSVEHMHHSRPARQLSQPSAGGDSSLAL